MTNKITMPFDKETMLRIPSKQNVRYQVDEDGIRKTTEALDQFGDVMDSISIMVLSKKAFIAAYNAYIKDIES